MPAINDLYFGNEKGNMRRLPSRFFYNEIRLDPYSHSGKNYDLIVRAEYVLPLSEATKLTECSKPDLLCSFLTLRNKLSDVLFQQIGKIYQDFTVETKDIELIIKWCKKHGFPFECKTDSINQGTLFKLPPPVASFRVWDFIHRLNGLHNAFLLYQRISGNFFSHSDNKYKKLSKEKCNLLFNEMYQAISFINTISFDNEIHLIVRTKDLFDAAHYQLALLCQSSEEIAECPLCHEIFQREYGRIYCNNLNKYGKRTCYSQKKNKRDKLRKMKEGK